MQEIVNFFSFLINVFRQLLTLHDGFRRFMTLFFTLFLFLILCIIFFSIIFLFHSHNFFLRSFCHIKNNASSAFSKSKKCNASFFSNFCFSYHRKYTVLFIEKQMCDADFSFHIAHSIVLVISLVIKNYVSLSSHQG